MIIIGDGIRKIRKAKKKSLDWLAEETGISRRKLSEIETGGVEAHPTEIERIAKALQVDVPDLKYRHRKYKI